MKRKEKKQRAEITTFTSDEQAKIVAGLGLENRLSSLDEGTLHDRWGDYMMDNLKAMWISYSFRDHAFNVSRFTYLHKGHTTMFIDLKAMGLFRVIQQLDPFEPVTSPISVHSLKEYSEAVMSSYLRSLGSFENEEFVKWSKLNAKASSKYLKAFNEYMFKSMLVHGGDMVEVRELEMWLRMHRIFIELVTGLLDVCYGFHNIGTSPSILPRPQAKWPTVLDVSHVLFLQSQLTKHCTKRWRMIFHNGGNGNNYTMLSNWILDVGPTLIVIRDHGGYIFGGFASESWKQSTIFYGDIRSFLFQLYPDLKKFEATGYNFNFQYHNQHLHTMPNGFGMGGLLHFWGLWIDSDFGNGTCSDFCSTFINYERPSSSVNFTYDHIEVWAVGEDMTEDANAHQAFAEDIRRRSNRSTVSSNHEETKALLRMAGKEMPSDALPPPDN